MRELNFFSYLQVDSKFESACQKIESNPNYQPHITEKDLLYATVETLLNLQLDENKALVHPSTIKALSTSGEVIGVVYQIKIPRCHFVNNRATGLNLILYFDDELVLLVRKQGGTYSLHKKQLAATRNFDYPLDPTYVKEKIGEIKEKWIEKLKISQLETHFNYPWLRKFEKACKIIESDCSFRSDTSFKALLNILADKSGCAKHASRQISLIQPSAIKALSLYGEEIGKVYEIKIPSIHYFNDKINPLLTLYFYHRDNDDKIVLLVDKQGGNYSFHSRKAALEGNFNCPLTNQNIDDYLNCDPLIPLQEKEQVVLSGCFSR